jgi:hypothetical protein
MRLFWATFGAGVGKGVTFQGVVMGIVGVVERLGRWFQIGVDAVVTFRQALAGDWFNNGSASALVNTIGRIGLALRDIGRAFQAGGAGGALAQLWTGYLQPALTNAWASLTGWIGAQIPGLLIQALAHLGCGVRDWAGGIWTNNLQPEIAQTLDQLQTR